MRLAICYVSNCNLNLSEDEIQELLRQTQIRNNKRNYKGLLLYSGGNFFQILEGNSEGVLKLWGKIKIDNRHKNIIKVFQENITKPPFDGYVSEFISAGLTHKEENLKRLFDQLKSLDSKPRIAAREMLKQFLMRH